MHQKGIKLLCTVAALACIASLFSACGGSAGESTASSGTTPAASTSQPAQEAAADDGQVGNVYREGLPIVKEPETFRTVVSINPYLKTPAKDLTMWQELGSRTNLYFEFEEIPASNYNEKVNLLISSNDLPDVFLRSIKDITEKHYINGQFMALDDLIEEWAPNYAQVLSNPVIRANISAMDGKLYTTPHGINSPWLEVNQQMFLNTEWLEALGLSMPTTLEEYKDVLTAFKTQDPNGNGLADELPLVMRMDRNNNMLLPFFGNFGLAIDQDYAMLDGTTYVLGPQRQEFRDGLEYIHTLYAEGLFDPENLTQGMAEMQAKGSGEHQLIGSLIGFWADDYCTGEGTLAYDSIPVFTGREGAPTWIKNPNIPTAEGMTIPTTCKNPQALIRFADYIIESAYRTFEVNYGPEELGLITTTAEGPLHLNSDKAPEGLTFEEWCRQTTIRDMIPFVVLPDQVLQGRTVDLAPQRKLAYMEKYMDVITYDVLTPGHTRYYESEDKKQLATTIWTDLLPLIENFVAQSIINGVTDESWDSFQNTLKSAKVDQYLEIRQLALDHYFDTVG
ncbi:extracellular solute-binding protein [Ruminococcaceae bacterium OttesenSCG-928-L11]|nr:extracellular solute-binding protein [Ruminococcaceae bacterium OttesenSCG-928-L11]